MDPFGAGWSGGPSEEQEPSNDTVVAGLSGEVDDGVLDEDDDCPADPNLDSADAGDDDVRDVCDDDNDQVLDVDGNRPGDACDPETVMEPPVSRQCGANDGLCSAIGTVNLFIMLLGLASMRGSSRVCRRRPNPGIVGGREALRRRRDQFDPVSAGYASASGWVV